MSLSAFPEKANKREVFVIDLTNESPTVEVLQGKNAGFGPAMKAAVDKLRLGDGPYRLHDWGGVISIAEEGNRNKLSEKKGADVVFSFTPWNAKGKENILGMIEFARAAGFVAMVIMTQKEGSGGKADTFAHFRNLRESVSITYYEDTYGVIKNCIFANTTCYHVPSPVFPVEESEKVPEVIDGSVDGYLDLWEAPSNAAPASSASGKDDPAETLVSMSPSKLNEYLACNSYLGSEAGATMADYQQCDALSSLPADVERYPHLQRWRAHISHLMSRFGNFDFLGKPLPAGALSSEFAG